jgi:hypothetical protein
MECANRDVRYDHIVDPNESTDSIEPLQIKGALSGTLDSLVASDELSSKDDTRDVVIPSDLVEQSALLSALKDEGKRYRGALDQDDKEISKLLLRLGKYERELERGVAQRCDEVRPMIPEFTSKYQLALGECPPVDVYSATAYPDADSSIMAVMHELRGKVTAVEDSRERAREVDLGPLLEDVDNYDEQYGGDYASPYGEYGESNPNTETQVDPVDLADQDGSTAIAIPKLDADENAKTYVDTEADDEERAREAVQTARLYLGELGDFSDDYDDGDIDESYGAETEDDHGYDEPLSPNERIAANERKINELQDVKVKLGTFMRQLSAVEAMDEQGIGPEKLVEMYATIFGSEDDRNDEEQDKVPGLVGRSIRRKKDIQRLTKSNRRLKVGLGASLIGLAYLGFATHAQKPQTPTVTDIAAVSTADLVSKDDLQGLLTETDYNNRQREMYGLQGVGPVTSADVTAFVASQSGVDQPATDLSGITRRLSALESALVEAPEGTGLTKNQVQTEVYSQLNRVINGQDSDAPVTQGMLKQYIQAQATRMLGNRYASRQHVRDIQEKFNELPSEIRTLPALQQAVEQGVQKYIREHPNLFRGPTPTPVPAAPVVQPRPRPRHDNSHGNSFDD